MTSFLPSFRRNTQAAVFALAALVLSGQISACSSLKGKGKDKAASAEPTESADELYQKGVKFLNDGNYKKAVQAFKDLDTVYPYSEQAVKGEVLSAYASYSAEEYDDAADMLDKYIKFHPGDQEAPYAYYLKALSFYDRISDIGRDQGVTNLARGALLDVVRRYPDSDYARDAKLKLDLVNDHLAGKEVAVGIFYQKQMKPVAAINRFRTVLEKFDATTHVQEALFRLTETYLSIGVVEEARKYAAVLGYNYPKSKWYRYAHDLLKKRAPEALRDSPVPGQEDANVKADPKPAATGGDEAAKPEGGEAAKAGTEESLKASAKDEAPKEETQAPATAPSAPNAATEQPAPSPQPNDNKTEEEQATPSPQPSETKTEAEQAPNTAPTQETLATPSLLAPSAAEEAPAGLSGAAEAASPQLPGASGL